MHGSVGADEDVVDGAREEDEQSSGGGQAHEEARVLLYPGALLHAIRPVLLLLGRVTSLVHNNSIPGPSARVRSAPPSHTPCPV